MDDQENHEILSPATVMVVGMGMKAKDFQAAELGNGNTIACVSCRGAKINKKGKQCKKCKGTGLVSTESFAALRNIINQEVNTAVERIMRE
jgi:DnaJ-class molecular chaperone